MDGNTPFEKKVSITNGSRKGRTKMLAKGMDIIMSLYDGSNTAASGHIVIVKDFTLRAS